MREAVKMLSYALFPKRCELCGEVIALDKTRCGECEALKIIDGKICNKCGREVAKCVCSVQKFSPEYKAFCAPFYFDGSPKKGVYRLKAGGFKGLVPAMSKSIVKAVKLRFENVEFDVVTCVPMNRGRERRRGYNQSELLARAVAEKLNVRFDKLLYKNRRTHSQQGYDAKRRRVNLYNAFSVFDNKDVSDKIILLVDDVKTTGSTLSELAFELKDNGAAAVYACSFTVTDKK